MHGGFAPDLAEKIGVLLFAYPATKRFDEREVRRGGFILVTAA
jgi:hypothetical protein